MPTATERRPANVLAAATEVFLRHGFSAATTDMIQREAGVSKATVYAHYRSKEQLFAAVIKAACEELTAEVLAVSIETELALEPLLKRLGAAYLQLLLSPRGLALFRVVTAEAPRFPELGHMFYLAGPQVIQDAMAAHLQHAAQARHLDLHSVGVEAAASLFLSLVRGPGQLECLTHPAARPAAPMIDRWVNQAVATFVAAFGVRSVPAAPRKTSTSPPAARRPASR